MISFARANTYFENLNSCLIGLSVDSNASHLAWVYDIYCRTGIRIPFPIIADRNGEIARKYGMISNDISNTETVRNVYIIDDKGIIRLILVYPMNVGRCIPEILRSLQALQVADSNNASMPANWIPCEPVIVKSPTTFEELLERNNELNQNRNGINWYLSFKQPQNCNLIENNNDRYVFECASSSGTMTIYDKVDKIYYVSNIQQIKYDADGNQINL